MKYATFILVVLLVALCTVTWFLADPILFVIGLFLIPNIMQGLPWALAAADSLDDMDDEENDDPKAGFHADIK